MNGSGPLVLTLLFSFVPAYFLGRGLGAKLPSRRLVNIALFCGLTVFVLPEVALHLAQKDQPTLFKVIGTIRVALGGVGCILVWTAWQKRLDGGASATQIIVAFILCLSQFAVGLGNFSNDSTTTQDTDQISLQIGQLLAALIITLPAFYFLNQGVKAETRSRRYANLALFCGLGSLIQPELAFQISPMQWPGLFLLSGMFRDMLGLTGIVLAVLALRLRRDGGVGFYRPATAIGC